MLLASQPAARRAARAETSRVLSCFRQFAHDLTEVDVQDYRSPQDDCTHMEHNSSSQGDEGSFPHELVAKIS